MSSSRRARRTSWETSGSRARVERRSRATRRTPTRSSASCPTRPRSVDAAIAAAAEALRAWSDRLAPERGDVLGRWNELLGEHADELAPLWSREMGKPLAESKAEIGRARMELDYAAGEGTRLHGATSRRAARGRPLAWRACRSRVPPPSGARSPRRWAGGWARSSRPKWGERRAAQDLVGAVAGELATRDRAEWLGAARGGRGRRRAGEHAPRGLRGPRPPRLQGEPSDPGRSSSM
jgi:hypothetical protein